jgi:uncharacterized protein YndB with AHSA1/START domain
MFRKLLTGLGALVLVFVLVVATRPSTFHLERSITIAAPPEKVYAQVEDFHAWRAWSPWEGLDPNLKRTYEGPNAGKDASYAWAGNDKAGEGRMTIEKADKPKSLEVKLEFIKPFPATNTATFTFVPVAEGTKLTWAMDGKNGFLSKAFSLFVDMDKLVGGDFERGLASMKTVVEAPSNAAGSTTPPAPPSSGK